MNDQAAIVTGRDKVVLRAAKPKDIPTILDRVCEEVPRLPHYKGVRVDRGRIEFFLNQNVLSGDESTFWMRVLVDPQDNVVGGAAGYCVTMLLSWEKMCSDVFLYVMPEWRSYGNVMKLISSYKKWAINRKATIIQATHTGGYRTEQMDRLLKSAGFNPIGTIYYMEK